MSCRDGEGKQSRGFPVVQPESGFWKQGGGEETPCRLHLSLWAGGRSRRVATFLSQVECCGPARGRQLSGPWTKLPMGDGNSEVNDNMPMRDFSTSNCSIFIVQLLVFSMARGGVGR